MPYFQDNYRCYINYINIQLPVLKVPVLMHFLWNHFRNCFMTLCTVKNSYTFQGLGLLCICFYIQYSCSPLTSLYQCRSLSPHSWKFLYLHLYVLVVVCLIGIFSFSWDNRVWKGQIFDDLYDWDKKILCKDIL